MLRHTLIRKLGWLQSWYAGFGEETNLFPVPASERLLGRHSGSLVNRLPGCNCSSRSVFLNQSLPVPLGNVYTVMVYLNIRNLY